MQAIVVSALGDSSSLQLRSDVPVPVAPPGHLLVKLQYSGVNFIDTYFRSGLYATQLPYIPGDSNLFHFLCLPMAQAPAATPMPSPALPSPPAQQ